MTHGMNAQDIHPFVAAAMMQQCGMPTLGRRSMGFGRLASHHLSLSLIQMLIRSVIKAPLPLVPKARIQCTR